MKLAGKYHLMVIPPSTDGVRQFTIPQWLVPGAISASALLIIVTVILSFLAARNVSRAERFDSQRLESISLRAQLADLTRDLSLLRKQLTCLEESEKRVRMVFGLPEINPAVRALGTGGSVVPFTASPSALDLQTYDVESEVDRLLRRCSFERENYDAIYQELMHRKDRLDRTPSVYPVDGFLARGFGVKPDPFTGENRLHSGLDVAASIGTPVHATADGKVASAEYQPQFGNLITLDHGDGVQTCYGHLSRFTVKPKAKVHRGDVIGYVGNTGYSTGPHCHYEVHIDGRPVNPMSYICDGETLAALPTASGGNP
jgi:murein DD-endopeptidase MepM/ murein hydrolase activator NlpD